MPKFLSFAIVCGALCAAMTATPGFTREIGGCTVPTNDASAVAFQVCMASNEAQFLERDGQYYFCPTEPGFRNLSAGISCRRFKDGLWTAFNLTDREPSIAVADLIGRPAQGETKPSATESQAISYSSLRVNDSKTNEGAFQILNAQQGGGNALFYVMALFVLFLVGILAARLLARRRHHEA